MDVLGSLPVWQQLLIAVLVAVVLIVMNFGWLLQAKGWMERQRQQRPDGQADGGMGATTHTSASARPERDRV